MDELNRQGDMLEQLIVMSTKIDELKVEFAIVRALGASKLSTHHSPQVEILKIKKKNILSLMGGQGCGQLLLRYEQLLQSNLDCRRCYKRCLSVSFDVALL